MCNFRERKNKILDAATIYPGKGGAGGGIWSYAENLIKQLDAAVALVGCH